MDSPSSLYVGCDVLRRRDIEAPEVEHIHALLWCDEEQLAEEFEILGRPMPAISLPPEELRSLIPEGILFLGHLQCIHVRASLQPNNPYGRQISTIGDLFWLADTAGQLYADLVKPIEDHIDQIGDMVQDSDVIGLTLSLRENFILSPLLDPLHSLRRVLEEVSGYPIAGCALSVHAATELTEEMTRPANETYAVEGGSNFWEKVTIGKEEWMLRFAVSPVNLRQNVELPWRPGLIEGKTPPPHPACVWIDDIAS